MERDDYIEQPDTPRCGWCNAPLTGNRRGSSYCSRAHKNSARRARKRTRQRVDTLRSRYPFPDEPGDGLREFSDFGELPGDFEDGDEDGPGIHAGDHRAPDPWAMRDAAWNERARLVQAIESIEGHYQQLARPYLDQLRRNPGVRPAALVALEQECEQKINAILKAHERAQALERAVRSAPQQVATAHERAVEQAAARAFARDLGRGRFLQAEPEPAGRGVRQTWIW